MNKITERKSITLLSTTRRAITQVFNRLDYHSLGSIYCDHGGSAFWNDRKWPCQQMGITLATVLKKRLSMAGRSLYIGAGVAELPMLILETIELGRSVAAYNLRTNEVGLLNQACQSLSFTIQGTNAQTARGSFDHIWMVSVLNDPECYPETSSLSYGRANPVTFNSRAFSREREKILQLTDRCLSKLSQPGLITTSVEEIPWITDWYLKHHVPFQIEKKVYPSAIVGDPICFIRIGKRVGTRKKKL